MHVDVTAGRGDGRAIGDAAGAGGRWAGNQSSGCFAAAYLGHGGQMAGESRGVRIGILPRGARRAGRGDAAPGDRQRSRLGSALKLSAVLVDLADVDHQGTDPEQHAAADQHGHEHRDATPLVAPQQAQQWAGQAHDQVSHGITPCAVSVSPVLEPEPPPTSLAMAPTGVMKVNG